MQLGEVAGLRQPVIHLDVDVQMVVRGPWWSCVGIPLALQVGREAAGTRRGDEQVAAELEIGFHEVRIVMVAFLEALEPVFGGQGKDGIACLADVELNALKYF